MSTKRYVPLGAGLLFTLLSCSESEPTSSLCSDSECPAQTCDSFDPLRRPLFGDTHVHTALSYDANVRGTRLGPDGAYRYARGEAIGVQPYDEAGEPLRMIQRDRPLDFVMISDHADFLGAVSQCTNPEKPAYDHPECQLYRSGPLPSFVAFGSLLNRVPGEAVYPALCGDDAALCINEGLDVWQASIEQAEAAHDQSSACEFSALIGYEWSAGPRTNNLHRNIVFRNGVVPDRAVGYFDEPYVEGLWEALRAECMDTDTGCDALTIPHNPNLAGGTFFEQTGRDGPFDANYVAERAAMEPIIEIYQHKGESECKPGETISDELCGFEKLPFNNFGASTTGIFVDPAPQDFVRAALGEGMKLEGRLGANPFKHGIVASTDTHISAPGATREVDYPGQPTPAGISTSGFLDDPYRSPGGLAGVWAEENSREAIFLAMRRKETFGTSGPQIAVRFFGGWSYPDDVCNDPNLAEVGYARGVPMGSDLPPRSGGTNEGPTFVAFALQDPGTSQFPGTALQRAQIVKGWIDDTNEYRVEVYDVGGDPDNGATVDIATCDADPGSGGFASLCTTWTDPSFDLNQRAFYYARIVENPTCRWTQRQCIGEGVDCAAPETVTEGFEECCDLTDAQCAAADVDCSANVAEGLESCCRPRVPKTVQERAWTSPIWYSPS